MAEAFLERHGRGDFIVESAGIEPGVLNPLVVEAMQEVGVDISANRTKDVFDFLKRGITFNCVITVCDETAAERCPVFPGVAHRLHWGFPDPSSFAGTREEKLAQIRTVRDAIDEKVRRFVKERP
jgi:arsenate reductase